MSGINKDELVKAVKAELDSEKATEEMQKQLDEAKVTLEELRPLMEERDSEIAALKSANEQLQASSKEEIERLSAKVEELEAEKKSLQERAEAAEGELAENKARDLLQERVDFLVENDILRSSEEAQHAQLEKVSVMSGEQFEDYCADLIDIKLSVAAATVEEISTESNNEDVVSSAAKELVSNLDQPENEAKATAEFLNTVIAQAKKKSAQAPKVEKEESNSEAAGEAEETSLNMEEASVQAESSGYDFARLTLGLTERI